MSINLAKWQITYTIVPMHPRTMPKMQDLNTAALHVVNDAFRTARDTQHRKHRLLQSVIKPYEQTWAKFQSLNLESTLQLLHVNTLPKPLQGTRKTSKGSVPRSFFSLLLRTRQSVPPSITSCVLIRIPEPGYLQISNTICSKCNVFLNEKQQYVNC